MTADTFTPTRIAARALVAVAGNAAHAAPVAKARIAFLMPDQASTR